MKRLDYHLYLMTVLTETSGFLVVFAVSRALAESEASSAMMGFVGAANAMAYGVMSIIAGRWADRIDARRQAMGGAAFMALSAAALVALRPSHPWAALPYAMVGAGQGIVYTAIIAWLGRAYGKHVGRTGISRSLILFCLSWNAGMIVGQGGGGALFLQDERLPIAVAMVLALLNTATAWRTGSLTVAPREDRLLPADDVAERQRLSAAFMMQGWLANLGGTFCMGVIFYLLPNVMVLVGIASDRHGFMLAIMRCVVIGMYLSMYATRVWHHRFSTALLAQCFGIAGMLTLAAAQTAITLTCGLVLMGMLCGYNYFASLYYSTTGTADDQRGAAGGIHEATLAIGIGAGSLVGGLAGDYSGIRAPYVLGAMVIGALAVVQMMIFIRRR